MSLASRSNQLTLLGVVLAYSAWSLMTPSFGDAGQSYQPGERDEKPSSGGARPPWPS